MAATENIELEILKEAIIELEEAKKLVLHDCKVMAIQKINFAIASIKAKAENSSYFN